jgi:hypothetical protein
MESALSNGGFGKQRLSLRPGRFGWCQVIVATGTAPRLMPLCHCEKRSDAAIAGRICFSYSLIERARPSD